MRARLFVLVIFAFVGGCRTQPTVDTRPVGGGFVTSPVQLDTPDGVARGRIAVIDLADPRVKVEAVVPVESGERLDRKTTEAVVREGLADLAINANYFGNDGIVGLVVIDGEVFNPARGDDPVLLVYNGRAVVSAGVKPDLTGVQSAVAGVGPNATISDGTALVLDGQNLGATARVEPNNRHPRTAAGVDSTGRRLILMVVDGRQPGHSVGVTLPELADLMIDAGADDAVNLDGGGSAAMVWRDGDATIRSTRQSGDVRRPVPVHLGVRVSSPRSE